MSAVPHGTLRWVDLGSTDVPATLEFYRQLFGWEPEELNDGEEHDWYTMRRDGAMITGIGGIQAAEPQGWTTFIHCDDVHATRDRVVAAGGAVVTEPLQAFEYGWTAIFTDPAGAHFAVWQAGTDLSVDDVHSVPNSLCWNELWTPDVAAATTFYKDVFGWEAKADQGYTRWLLDGEEIGGATEGTMPGADKAGWLAYFAVADCDAAVAQISDLGGAALGDPISSPVGRFAYVKDAQDAAFGVIQLP